MSIMVSINVNARDIFWKQKYGILDAYKNIQKYLNGYIGSLCRCAPYFVYSLSIVCSSKLDIRYLSYPLRLLKHPTTNKFEMISAFG